MPVTSVAGIAQPVNTFMAEQIKNLLGLQKLKADLFLMLLGFLFPFTIVLFVCIADITIAVCISCG